MGTIFFWVRQMIFELVEDLRSEELKAVVRENAICLVVVTGSPWEQGSGRPLPRLS